MLIAGLLQRLVREGRVTVVDAAGRRHEFVGTRPGPSATIRFTDRRIERQLLVNPKLYFGEGYMDSRIVIEEGTLVDVLDILTRNLAAIETTGVQPLRSWFGRAFHFLLTHNPIGKAQKNVAHHYDLSGQLYDLFLDQDRQYSCAYFATDNDSLEVAQHNKKLHIAAKLLLKPGQRVLDIGSGWGGLGLYLAKLEDIDVTGVTLSTEQQKVSARRAEQEGLSDRVRFHLRDYRQQPGPFDRIVSVGMFEHVGPLHYREYFAKVNELLTEDGVMLLHSIARMEPPGSTNPWLRKYIFPGGYTPAISELMRAIEDVGLWVTDVEVLRLHYAKTLNEWHRRFQQNRDRIRMLYDERFCRMWEYYLVSCEYAFRNLGQMVVQIQLTRRQDAVPLTRDYISDYENRLGSMVPIAAQ
jgi:cyclopropane-fatty-acyl-phospholipid synthase